MFGKTGDECFPPSFTCQGNAIYLISPSSLPAAPLQFHLADIRSPSIALAVGAAEGRCARVLVLSPAGPGDPAAVSQDAARAQGRWQLPAQLPSAPRRPRSAGAPEAVS